MNPPNYSSQRELVCGLGQYKSYVVFIDTIMDFSRRALESDRTRRRGAHEYTSLFKHELETDLPKKLDSSTISTQSSTTLPDSRFDLLLTDSKFHCHDIAQVICDTLLYSNDAAKDEDEFIILPIRR
ncbi:unnamed protein product [Clonostachys rosea f. rosea IK726]|uniref:Uncharacterized protein n=1 Tax=Clonostachys rosea f. rosea IK726 TaxID=1349383 RepID=A0ACA9TEN3_BIOOC|nr:unnamed protein product [Clonostachys rosea f. rosea IK726]